MNERVRKSLIIVEGILCIPALAFIITSTSMDVAAHGIEGVGSVPALITLILTAMSMLIALAIYSFYKKSDSKFIQSGYDYIFNSLAVTILLSGIFYAIELNQEGATIDPAYSYAMMAIVDIYLVVYQRLNHRKNLYQYRGICFALLVVSFGLYLHLDGWQLWNIIGFGLMTGCVAIASILAILTPPEKKVEAQVEGQVQQPETQAESQPTIETTSGETSNNSSDKQTN